MPTWTRTAAYGIALAVVWKTLTNYFFLQPVPAFCEGHVHPAFQEVKNVFCRNVASGVEPGGSFAVYRQGQALVNLWGGYADQTARKLWTKDTLSQAWSSTKGVTAVVIAMLVDRGVIAYNKPVKQYWPEFAANGKENITVAMLLSHQAGLVYLGRKMRLYEYRDNWTEVERLMAERTPAWIPGTTCAYHAFTFGMYADALVRRVDRKHRNISQFFKEEVAVPFDIDFHIGLPQSQFHRSTRGSYTTMNEIFVNKFLLNPHMWVWLPEVFMGSVLYDSMNVFDIMDDIDMMNDADLRSIGLSSFNGFGTAASLAKLYDYLANGGAIKGKRLVSLQQIQQLSTPISSLPVMAALQPDVQVAAGMAIEKNILGQTTFGHRGYGGQNAYADPSQEIGVAYLTNFNSPFSESDDPRNAELVKALYRSLQDYYQSSND